MTHAPFVFKLQDLISDKGFPTQPLGRPGLHQTSIPPTSTAGCTNLSSKQLSSATLRKPTSARHTIHQAANMEGVDVHDMFVSSGKYLYKNELFADAEIVVGDEKWPIHKSILCTRSDWFGKALAGPFKEAITNKLDVTGHDPKLPVPTMKEIGSMRALADLFITANYFDLPILELEIGKVFESHLRHLQFQTGIKEPLLSGKRLEDFFHAAHLAYDGGLSFSLLRDPIKSFISNHSFLLVRDTRFMEELKAIPDLSNAIIRLLLPPESLQAKPEECVSCGQNYAFYSETWVARKIEHECEFTAEEIGMFGRAASRCLQHPAWP
ncbi:BTB/POZ protein [Apiospora hydei]|uniref:BTB/POZ protein n=1 Tax=Apiospora hydei TaxID=1337664 RepID=A0ABR1VLF0_9PEZI